MVMNRRRSMTNATVNNIMRSHEGRHHLTSMLFHPRHRIRPPPEAINQRTLSVVLFFVTCLLLHYSIPSYRNGDGNGNDKDGTAAVVVNAFQLGVHSRHSGRNGIGRGQGNTDNNNYNVQTMGIQPVSISQYPFNLIRNAIRHLQAHQNSNSVDERPSIPSMVSVSASTTTPLFSSASSGSSSVPNNGATLNRLETWCMVHMDVLYSKSLSIKCPFFRRRMADMLDGADMVMRFLLIRHKSLPLMGPPPGCRALSTSPSSDGWNSNSKRTHLPLNVLMETIRNDWRPDDAGLDTNHRHHPQWTTYQRHKGYYITGRLNSTIYRDDCWFHGPDPDMPVKGLRKYLNAASQLFDTKTSTAELLSLDVMEDNDNDDDNNNDDGNDDAHHHRYHRHKIKNTRQKRTDSHRRHPLPPIVATWRLQGVLHLPWHPSLPVWTGRTVYYLDDEHLIYRHEEYWDISVFRAFTQTLFPRLGNMIWKDNI